jgi:hypothetical protein
MQLDQNGACYLRDAKGKDLIPDPTDPSNPDQNRIMKDYALLMKLPNVLSGAQVDDTNTILLFAGCKVAGQVGLTQWVGDPNNLANLAMEYSSRFFQLVLEVHYKFVPRGIPEIITAKTLVVEPIEQPNVD